MLPPAELAAALAGISGAPFSGTAYRAIHLEALYGFHQPVPYGRPQPLYSLGAPAHGARFTPRGGPPSLYLAEDVLTATAEANQVDLALRAGQPGVAPQIPPTVIIAVAVRLRAVLDLTEPGTQALLGTDGAELCGSWRIQSLRGPSPTQQLGASVFADGRFQGMRYPSARLGGHACLVVFTERLQPPDLVEVHDPWGNVQQRLP